MGPWRIGGYLAGRYRDWSWCDSWTDVPRCAPGTFTAVRARNIHRGRGRMQLRLARASPPAPTCSAGLQVEWVFTHILQLSSRTVRDGRSDALTGDRR